MKLENAPQNVRVHGDFESSQFAVGDIAFIVDMFADKIYSHKERAVVRELSCNAYDSHVMAGTLDKQFHIHLPTALSPWFSIRDFGTGLDDTEVRTIFAGVGISTKRDNNDVIGCFGIGSLSPYSLTDSFTVKSYKDGVCRSYLCHRDEERRPIVTLLSEQDTDEDNGVYVEVSVDGKFNEFFDAAVDTFKYWDFVPKINLKQCEEKIKEEKESYVYVGEDFGFSQSYGDTYAVMGNVAYHIPYHENPYHIGGYIKFDIGELDFDTSRENLSMTDKTKLAVKTKWNKVAAKAKEMIVDDIENQPTVFKKWLRFNKLSGICSRFGIRKDYDLPMSTNPMRWYRSRYYNCASKDSTHKVQSESVIFLSKSGTLNRIVQFVRDNKKSALIVTEEQIKECKIDREYVVDPMSLPKVERKQSAQSKVKTYEFKYSSKWSAKDRDHWVESELDLSQHEIVYVEINRWHVECEIDDIRISGSPISIHYTLKTLKEYGIDAPTVIGLKTSFLKTKQFKNANFTSLGDYVRREFAKIAPKKHYVFKEYQVQKIQNLEKVLAHPEIDAIIDLVNSQDNELISILKNIQLEITGADDSAQKKIDAFFDKYEMLDFVELSNLSGLDLSKVMNYIGGTAK